ncbi:MAG: putative toxin-antitoxin system toxin component, PIN family [Chloroflexi bacterium]|nr:putative toxin-antitoxin system toxin component, PIN family [Chloroflexota bacterium]
MKLVIDTNTLVSGTLWSGPPSRLVEALEEKRATLLMSAQLLAEFGDVVGRAKLASRLAVRDVTSSKLVARLARQAEFVSPVPIALPPSLRDAKDLIVLAVASTAKADAIVTGDEDLLTMKAFEGIPILTVREALEKLGVPAE